MTEIDAATEAIGEPVEAGLWLARHPHRWYHSISTGTELDLILVVLLFPVILCYWLFRSKRGAKNQTGPIYLALTDRELVFFAATESVFPARPKRCV